MGNNNKKLVTRPTRYNHLGTQHTRIQRALEQLSDDELEHIMKTRKDIIKNSRNIAALLALTLTLLTGCSGDNPADPGGSNNTQGFDAVISSGGEFTPVTPSNDTLSVDSSLQEVVGGEDFFCTTVRVSATEAPGDFPLFDPNADLIFPGNLLQGATLEAATPSPIPVKRGPGTIVMTLNNGADSVSRFVNEISLSSVFNAQNQIISENPGAIPARFAFTFEQVNSREQLALALDVSFSNLATSVSAQLAFSSDREYNRFMVKLDQSFFTMAYQLPTTKEEIFAPEVTPERLSQFISDGNPAAFISSVTYGRKFYLLIESTSSKLDMEASINASFGAAVAQGSIGASAKYVSTLSNIRIKAYALGGEAGAALGAITTDFESLKTFLAQGATLNTGLPLSYVVRSLSRPDKIVKVKVATEYDLQNCIPIGESIDNPIVWYKADDGVITAGSAKLVTKWRNFFGNSQFDAKPPTKPYGGQLITNALPGPNLPAVRFAPGSVTSNNEGALGFSGINFVGTDYTIWVVGRMASQFSNYPELFLYGSGASSGSSLELGFRNSNQFLLTDIRDTLNVSLATPVDGYKLYTIRFSQTKGVEVFVNGQLTPSASNSATTQALNAFLGARIGSKNGNSLYIAEIKAYGSAVTELQRKSLDKKLLIKYGL